jgi:hypothetical protein
MKDITAVVGEIYPFPRVEGTDCAVYIRAESGTITFRIEVHTPVVSWVPMPFDNGAVEHTLLVGESVGVRIAIPAPTVGIRILSAAAAATFSADLAMSGGRDNIL